MRAMEAYFKGDAKRINHAHRGTKYAKEICETIAHHHSPGKIATRISACSTMPIQLPNPKVPEPPNRRFLL